MLLQPAAWVCEELSARARRQFAASGLARKCKLW
jgi:hypothetical protein